jgi:hypothetical protein
LISAGQAACVADSGGLSIMVRAMLFLLSLVA